MKDTSMTYYLVQSVYINYLQIFQALKKWGHVQNPPAMKILPIKFKDHSPIVGKGINDIENLKTNYIIQKI